MTPTVGRIIHVTDRPDSLLECVAAIVTGLDHTTPQTIYATAFPRHGASTTMARPIVLMNGDNPRWHDPRECPRDGE